MAFVLSRPAQTSPLLSRQNPSLTFAAEGGPRKRGIRYRNVAIRSVKVEEVEAIGILPGRHKNPVCANGSELTEVLSASRIIDVESWIGRIADRVNRVRDEGSTR